MDVSKTTSLLYRVHKFIHDAANNLVKMCNKQCEKGKDCPFWFKDECILLLLDIALQNIENAIYILEGKKKKID
ncbi:MAG: hypothetical protein Q6363_007925 [Candidatus Njordarchaeota archaeon]